MPLFFDKMKPRFLASVLLLSLPAVLSAQEDIRKMFDDFQRQAGQSLSDFQNAAQNSFVETLLSQWESFHVFAGNVRPRKPEPEKLPVAPDGETPETISVPTVPMPDLPELDVEVDDIPEEPLTEDLKPLDSKPKKPIPLVNPLYTGPYFDMGGKDPSKGFAWYGMMANMAPLLCLAKNKPTLVENGKVDISGDVIARFWMMLENEEEVPSFKQEVLESFKKAREENDLSDWALFQMIVRFSEHWWKDRSEQAIVQTFLLNHMGIDARLASIETALTILMPFQQTIYARRFIKMENDVPFYIMCDDQIERLYSYPIAFSGEVQPLSVSLAKGDLVFAADKVEIVKKKLPTLGLTLSVPVSKSRCSFYLDYPQVDVVWYARERIGAQMSDAMISQLKGLKAFDEAMAANLLLHSIQKDFDYATDQDQFGIEKPFFVTENFVYPQNDCEDRSILYAYLVKHVLGLDVVLLDYPEHIATAVCFHDEKIPGAYITHKGKRYLVCDPTYVGANIGMVMPMFKETAAKVIQI